MTRVTASDGVYVKVFFFFILDMTVIALGTDTQERSSSESVSSRDSN